jgi:predicted acyl esterase
VERVRSCIQSQRSAPSGDYTRFWEQRSAQRRAANVTAAVLQTHGYEDGLVYVDQVDGWFDGLENARAKRLILGQWNHGTPTVGDWPQHGGILHRWMDHLLQGIDPGLLDELAPVVTQDSQGRWRGLEAFPRTPRR